METPSKWSLSRLMGLASLIVALLGAVGGFFDFFHLTAPGWIMAITAFISSVTERVQGGKTKLIAEIEEQSKVSPRSYPTSGEGVGPSSGQNVDNEFRHGS